MASYPTSIKTWTTKYNQGQAPTGQEQEEINYAEHVNAIQDEVAAIQTVLGTNPHGTAATVKARIAAVESGKSDTTHHHNETYVRRDNATTKGDLLVATAAATFTRVGVGAAGQVLLPDTAQASGVRWRQLGHQELANLTGKAHPDLLDEAAHTALHPSGVGVKPFVGMITPSARSDIPAEWLECAGQAVSRTTYSELFGVIGTTYGAGDGANTFNVPDLRGRFIVGHAPTDTSFDALNEKGGAKTVALTTANLPAHDHGATGDHSHSGTTGNQSVSHSHSATTGSDSHSHTANSAGSHDHNINAEQTTNTNHQHHITSGYVAGHPDGSNPGGTLGTSAIHDAGAHTHSTTSDSHTHSVTTGNQSASHTHGFSTSTVGSHTHASVGSGTAHENLPPYIVLKFVIFAGA